MLWFLCLDVILFHYLYNNSSHEGCALDHYVTYQILLFVTVISGLIDNFGVVENFGINTIFFYHFFYKDLKSWIECPYIFDFLMYKLLKKIDLVKMKTPQILLIFSSMVFNFTLVLKGKKKTVLASCWSWISLTWGFATHI